MYAYVWEYRVAAEVRQSFETAYGPEGEWARLFRRSEGYVGTDLLSGKPLAAQPRVSAPLENPMAEKRNRLPENTSLIMPRLVCRDAAAEMEFCVQTFEAVELNRRTGPDGKVAHGLLTIGPEMIMIEGEWPSLPSRAPTADGSSPVPIFIYVPDVDQTVERAVASGAKILVPLQDQFWGDRLAWFMDPAGHVWTVASRVEDTTAEERTARWDSILAEKPSE